MVGVLNSLTGSYLLVPFYSTGDQRYPIKNRLDQHGIYLFGSDTMINLFIVALKMIF
jgi:hypothetical protein